MRASTQNLSQSKDLLMLITTSTVDFVMIPLLFSWCKYSKLEGGLKGKHFTKMMFYDIMIVCAGNKASETLFYKMEV